MKSEKIGFYIAISLALAVLWLVLCIPSDPQAYGQNTERPAEAAVVAVAAAAVVPPTTDEETPVAAAGGRQQVFGPGMVKVTLPPGTYLIITAPDDPKLPMTSQTFTIGKGGDDPDDPPDPDDPINIQIREMIAPIVDPDKARTANDLVMGLNVGPLGLIESGDIKTSADAEEATNATIKFMLQARGKTEAWRPFSEGMKDLIGGCTDLAGCTSLLKTVVTELEAVQ